MLDRVPGAKPGAVSGDRVVIQGSPKPGGVPGFAETLATQLELSGIRLSAHAQQRLQQSQTSLDPAAADRLSGAVQRAEQKGSRDSLVLLDDLAFVVSVKNKTVVTAVEGGRARENVFTNIDSVVIG